MSKSERKKRKVTTATKGTRKISQRRKNAKRETKATEYVNHLLELNKLQGVLLTYLKKEVS